MEINKYEKGDMPIVGLVMFFITFIIGFFGFILISNDFIDKYNTTTTGLMNNTSTAYNLTMGVTDSIASISPVFILLFGAFIVIVILLYFSN